MSRRHAFELDIDAHPATSVAQPRARSSAETEPGDDPELAETLHELREVLWRFPLAAQAAYAALVREGKAYEQTPEGRALMQRMLRAPVAHRARVVWEVLTGSDMSESPSGALPSLFLDRLAKTLVSERLEPVLARLFDRAR